MTFRGRRKPPKIRNSQKKLKSALEAFLTWERRRNKGEAGIPEREAGWGRKAGPAKTRRQKGGS